MSDTTTWTPLDSIDFRPLVEAHGGSIHGDDSTGAVDVEFHSILHAARFTQDAVEDFGWAVDLRAGDVVTSLFDEAVVLTVRP